MKPFTLLKAVAAPLNRANVDTDQIIPKQFLKAIHRTGFGRNLFFDWRYVDGDPERPNPDFVLNQAPFRQAQVLVALENFGCGSSREHAAWALDDFGIRCVIAPSFSDIFYNNALQNGMLPARVSNEAARALIAELERNPGEALAVDLEAKTITSPSGMTVGFEIPEEPRHKLLHGLDAIGLTLTHDQEISDFERAMEGTRPWV
ncbi:MAG: 3-isopropylmalate dehydratase small subunit [Deltaproteobacteria bacterium]|nr:3-isopropylmalate dehydratase small subunit [Deltaproteobacteria bacterium]MDH4121984.1 3-isopropylmalate dehydratase small subunit [Deltaproteobacteria bacterium]